uniref:Protein phosphatase 1 regulatory subunit 13 like n=1 Tax=Malurus cyaneus samueli TaxID=2593467 RepID=A0A8C5X439_9PASS
GERAVLRSPEDLLDLTFQSLAMQHMDLKQVELDTAVAKVDELSRQLESSPAGSRRAGGASSGGRGIGGRLAGPPAARSPRPPPHFLGGDERAPSPRPKVLAVPSSGGGGGSRDPSPRPLPPRPYDFLGLGGSPRPGGGGAFLQRDPTAPPPYEVQGLYPSLSGASGAFRTQDDLGLKRRPQKSWNESDLDVAYEKKAPGWGARAWRGAGEVRGSGTGGTRGESVGATLPRNYKVSPLERRQEGLYRSPPSGSRTLPRGWHPGQQQPVSRIPVPPPPAGRPPRQRPLPLSMIFKLQNAFWEQGWGAPRGLPLLGGPRGAPQKLPALPPAPSAGPHASHLPPRVPSAPGAPRPRLSRAPPEAKRSWSGSQVATREGPTEGLPRDPAPGGVRRGRSPPAAALLPPEAGGASRFREAGEGRRPQCPRGVPVMSPLSPLTLPMSQELRSALRDPSSPRRRPGARVRLNPLVLLLDAARTERRCPQLNDPSQPNDEGITALHNAICGANYAVVDFLIASGANVNSPDSHGWTPLHCAASCNDTGVCVALVRHGAAVFATTGSDGSMAVDKCDPYREGYADCASYLTEVERGMGVLNSGVVYALWDLGIFWVILDYLTDWVSREVSRHGV